MGARVRRWPFLLMLTLCVGVSVALGVFGLSIALGRQTGASGAFLPWRAPTVQVVDGDTLRVDGQKYRLLGIDAPESSQTCADARGAGYACGAMATQRMNELVQGRRVSCQPTGARTYDRLVAVCYADGADLGQQLVTEGWALAYRTYSTAYVPHEDAARAARAGLWSGTFVPPWEHRHPSGASR
jgi:endonuclease YncB( thermonuclease family)